MNLRKQLSSWYHDGDLDENRFRYDALNGNIKVLNSKQIIKKAHKMKKSPNITPKSKRRMTRLIHQAQKNPYMHRIANVWNLKSSNNFEDNPIKTGKTLLNYVDTAKAQSGSSVGGSLADAENESPYVALARKGQVFHSFTKKWNKLNPSEKIINAKEAGLKADNEKVRTYPQVNNQFFKDDIKNSDYRNINFNGLKATVHYIQGNHSNNSQTLKLLKGLKRNFHQIDNEQDYNIINKRMKQAKRTTGTIKRHRIKGIKDNIALDKDSSIGDDNSWEIPSLKERLKQAKNIDRKKLIPQAYAEDFGTGNDAIGGNIDSFTSGFIKYKAESKFLHKMNMKAPVSKKLANKYSRKQIKKLKQETKIYPTEDKHYQAEINSYKSSIKKNKLNHKQSIKRIDIRKHANKAWQNSFPEIKRRNRIFGKQYKQARKDEHMKDGYAHNLVYAHEIDNKQFKYFKQMKPLRLAMDYAHIDRANGNNPKINVSQNNGVEDKLHLHYMHKNLPKMFMQKHLSHQQITKFGRFLIINQRVSKQLNEHKQALQNEYNRKEYQNHLKHHNSFTNKHIHTSNNLSSKNALLYKLIGRPSKTPLKQSSHITSHFTHSLHGRVKKHKVNHNRQSNIKIHRDGPQI